MSAPILVFGVANFGYTNYGGGHSIGDLSVLQQFLDFLKKNEINQIDTSRRYGNGSSEEMLGAVHTAERGFILDTKVTSTTPGSHTREKLRESVMKSLEALKVTKVHTMYLHAPDRSVPIEEVLHSVDELHREGAFEQFGVSNYSVEEVAQIVKISKEKNYVRPSVYQGMYNIFSRKAEDKLFPLLKKEKISFYAYSPLAGGLFNYSTKEEATSADSRYAPGSLVSQLYGNKFFKESYTNSLKRFDEVAQKAGLSKNEIALRWLYYHSQLKREDGDAILLGASKISQLEANIGDFKKGPLPDEIVQFLEEIWGEVKVDAPEVDFIVEARKS
eukprot:TRINITY_DN4012_c0_g1_i5.p2 TRINITY_DN4012_c0_g1~~TRINITY_DN4012_c0_g1_i5.p2  ORF type:complete len:331 (+),score=73.47 TRINITY_DN4012_c0_g1_i5:62-1054(+)